MTKEVYIKLKDGEKESEMKLMDVEPQHQLALMDGVFRFFDLDVDFKEMAEVYRRSGKAYKEFFNEMDSHSDYEHDGSHKEKNSQKTKVTAEEFTAAYEEKNNESEVIQPASSPEESVVEGYHPDYQFSDNNYFETGIKYDSLNRPMYRCRYKCPKCKSESNKYIRVGTKDVRCWQCNNVMKTRPATPHGVPQKKQSPNLYRDQNGNFYIAGDFDQSVITMSESEKED
ncbi:hypothetical protein QTG56_25575 (plasmid) [Rossellomorea sp. AcN35-11]|nr:hypothetical protein [Rossellomorea aquimaris]WJV31986.1 hypothetical protein QTG56_25575 [Rossellomorea sp. AcN35-11]